MKIGFATVISRVFDPFWVFLLLLVAAIGKSSLVGFEQVQFFIIASLVLVGIPIALLVFALKKGIVSNWDVSVRSERPKVFGMLLVVEIISVFLMRGLMDQFLLEMFLFILVVALGLAVVTLFWKMSGHASINAMVMGLIVAWYGWSWWPVLLVVPLVSWARVVRRDHTVAQVIAGAIYAWIMVILFRIVI